MSATGNSGASPTCRRPRHRSCPKVEDYIEPPKPLTEADLGQGLATEALRAVIAQVAVSLRRTGPDPATA